MDRKIRKSSTDIFYEKCEKYLLSFYYRCGLKNDARLNAIRKFYSVKAAVLFFCLPFILEFSQKIKHELLPILGDLPCTGSV
jgi:hypothetical protein